MNIPLWLRNSKKFIDNNYEKLPIYDLDILNGGNIKLIIECINLWEVNEPYPLDIYIHLLNNNDKKIQLNNCHFMTFLNFPLLGALNTYNIELLTYLKENNYEIDYIAYSVVIKTKNTEENIINIMEWLYNNNIYPEIDALNTALSIGNINIINKLISINCRSGSGIYTHAIKSENIEVIKLCLTLPNEISGYVFHENNYNLDKAIEIIKLLKENNFNFRNGSFYNSSFHKDKKVIWVRKKGSQMPWDTEESNSLTMNLSYHMKKWCINNGLSVDLNEDIDQIIFCDIYENNNLNIDEFLKILELF